MARVALLALLASCAIGVRSAVDWRRNAVIYQVYPRSFKDSNGDGIGDLNGITSKLEHIKDIGADAVWMSPIFASPQVDFGYDISNFTDINPEYGTLADFDKLVTKAKSLGLKVLLDFVPNHSSPEHPWFKKSVNKTKPYDEYYVWRDAKVVNGTRRPPNNWLSNFGGSAWEWNPTRGQYYLHQFAVGQPDLNYRSTVLQQEMKDALTFWLNRGVDGFRVDAINMMYEDARFLDEPRRNISGLPDTDYESLEHVYTRDLNETYDVVKSWSELLDRHSPSKGTKMILTEAYGPIDKVMRYYLAGSTVPFNFDFITELNNKSTALDYKRIIDRWNNNIPNKTAYVANWVVGNHDNHRVASRFGTKRADQLNILAAVLPGVAVYYNGDEIGMEDRNFTYAETVDPAGCNAGPDRYHLKSRDPERTPFQWDSTVSAGFSTSNKTWLPVHPNYKTLNLSLQKVRYDHHYMIFKALTRLKKRAVCRDGSLEVVLVTDQILAIIRRLPGGDMQTPVAALINFADTPHTFDASVWLDLPPRMIVATANKAAGLNIGLPVSVSPFKLAGAASVVLRG